MFCTVSSEVQADKVWTCWGSGLGPEGSIPYTAPGAGRSLYSQVQVEQVWMCPGGDGPLYGEAQWIMGSGYMGPPLLWTDKQTDTHTHKTEHITFPVKNKRQTKSRAEFCLSVFAWV